MMNVLLVARSRGSELHARAFINYALFSSMNSIVFYRIYINYDTCEQESKDDRARSLSEPELLKPEYNKLRQLIL